MFRELLRYLPDQGYWFAPQTTHLGFEISIDGSVEQPDPESMAIAERLGADLPAVRKSAVAFLRHHVKMSGEYYFHGIQVAASEDRHGTRVWVFYANEDDRYLRIEVGLWADDFRPKSAMLQYH
jgi:hypothetical protein